MSDKIKGLLYGSFVGDALTLGAHWIYNPSKIVRLYGRVTEFLPPISDSYHKAKKKGDFTHYGDQTLVLLDSIGNNKSFDVDDFSDRWKNLFTAYRGYVDGASKETLANLESGMPPHQAGSSSNDLSGAGRIAPLFLVYRHNDADAFIQATRTQTAMTHNNSQVVDSAKFFARVTMDILGGSLVEDALRNAAQKKYAHLPAEEWLQLASKHVGNDPTKAIKELGQTCHIPDGFPSTVFLLLKYPEDLETCLIENVMAGGDSAARGLILGMVLGARLGFNAIPTRWVSNLNAAEKIENVLSNFLSSDSQKNSDTPTTEKITFSNKDGISLNARLELPAGSPQAFALFAHCFTCSKDIIAATRICRELSSRGFAVLRFDFTGLGNSDGDFANTNFSSNLEDLISASNHLRNNFQAPRLLIGHSLGGTATLAVADKIPEVQGIITIGSPSDPLHVSHLLEDSLVEIEQSGTGKVNLGGRSFTIKKQFLDDLREQKLLDVLKKLRKATLILHSPVDQTVSIDHARIIFDHLKHPKSFVSLHPADHLLTKKEDAAYVAEVITAWSSRLIRTS